MGACTLTCLEAFGAIDQGGGFVPGKLQVIDQASLAQKIKDKKDKKYNFTLIDTRSESDFQKGSIPGAINLPFKKHRFLAESVVSTNEDVVCYGYSSSTPSDINAVIYLMNHGYEHVWYFKEGMAGWKKDSESVHDA